MIEVAREVARGCKRFILIRARFLIPSGLGVEGCVETEESRGANIVGKDGWVTVRKKIKWRARPKRTIRGWRGRVSWRALARGQRRVDPARLA